MNTTLRADNPDDNVAPLVNNRPTSARKLGVSVSNLDIMHREGRGPRCVMIGRRRFYLDADLLEFLQKSRGAA